MIPSKKKKVHQRVHHYTLSTTLFFRRAFFARKYALGTTGFTVIL